MHGAYDISEDDFTIVASDAVVATLDLAERLGWRAVTDKEREAGTADGKAMLTRDVYPDGWTIADLGTSARRQSRAARRPMAT